MAKKAVEKPPTEAQRRKALLLSIKELLTQYPMPFAWLTPEDFLRSLKDYDRKLVEVYQYQPAIFTLHYVERFGWVMAVLLIAKSRRAEAANRTYAIALKNGEMCRVGLGPHVKATLTFYGYVDRMPHVAQMTGLYIQGSEKANETRDVISTRRMRGTLRRGLFR